MNDFDDMTVEIPDNFGIDTPAKGDWTGFDNDETAKIAEYEPDLITYAQETVLKFLDGSLELNDENWEEYKATCESLGLSEILKVYQDAYDQRLAGER